MVKNYSLVRDKKGRISKVGKRDVDYLGFTVHEDNVVDVYKAWDHNVEDVSVFALTIEQKGGSNINSVYVKKGDRVEEITWGFNRDNNSHSKKKTKEDVIQYAENWMKNNPHPDL